MNGESCADLEMTFRRLQRALFRPKEVCIEYGANFTPKAVDAKTLPPASFKALQMDE